jgi:hypothetical protein
MMKLVEESAGLGELEQNGQALRQVRYRISRFQGIMEGSGLPIPGLYRIEGSIDFDTGKYSPDMSSANASPVGRSHQELIDAPLTLRLEDGRSLQITVVDSSGRVLSEGHGPMKCMCC